MYLAEASPTLHGPEKVGALLIALGPELSAAIIARLAPPEIERVMACVASVRGVAPELRLSLLEEFRAAYESQPEVAAGGLGYVEAVLGRALAGEQAAQVMERLRARDGAPAEAEMQFLVGASTEQLLPLLLAEHPQVISVVLSQISRDRAAVVLAGLPRELQGEVASRLIESRPAPPELVAEIDRGLALAATTTKHHRTDHTGPKALADLLSLADRSTEKTVLELLDAAQAEAVRKQMFVFEDLPTLADRDLQVVLQSAGSRDLALALKEADEALSAVVYRNMSERAAEAVREDIELLQRVRPRDVEAAQQRICAIVRDMIASGQIALAEETDAESPEPAP